MKAGRPKCEHNVVAIVVLLSLTEENKFDIVRLDEIKEFIKLTEEKDAPLCQSSLPVSWSYLVNGK